MKVEFVPVWKQVTPDLAQELMAFWQASKAVVEPGAAATRAPPQPGSTSNSVTRGVALGALSTNCTVTNAAMTSVSSESRTMAQRRPPPRARCGFSSLIRTLRVCGSR